jgi:DNA-binding XRE family transcriptional regulator
MNPSETVLNKKRIGKKLSKLRKGYISPTDRPLTSEDVYSFLGVSKSTYYNIERGEKELSFKEAYRICCLYSITFEELLRD